MTSTRNGHLVLGGMGLDLAAHVRARLAGYKVPREFVMVDELPHTATGKILKFALRGR